jgi:hypothetical protein
MEEEMRATVLSQARDNFHASLLEGRVLALSSTGVASNADKKNLASVKYAQFIAERLRAETGERLAAQTSGGQFETAVTAFLNRTFPFLEALRPGDWTIRKVGGRGVASQISNFEQYEHLTDLDEAVRENPQLRAMLGNSYAIAPDIVISRKSVSDELLNRLEYLVDEQIAVLSPFRSRGDEPKNILHAVISCKWTLRSDRAQNARSEALNLIRNRKGRAPHIAVVTAEPLPSRIASVALGTGDIDCVYHFALPELREAVSTDGHGDAIELLEMMIAGKRLRDIADLPLDLAI